MNEAKREDRWYASLPCQRSKVFTSLNSLIEKSAAKAACIPSLPTIPTPTSAAWIIPTSFPPSPMPKTAYFYFLQRFTPSVRSFFWLGEQRQQTTLGIFRAVSKKSFETASSSKTYARVLPSTIRIWLRLALTFSQWSFQRSGVNASSILMLD